MPPVDTTTRAYTLRLINSANSHWRDLLWQTHCTVNRGVYVWGDWLLTLRGGLPASLADDAELLAVSDKDLKENLKKQKLRDGETEADRQQELEHQRRNSLRVVLALSWLSVESPASLVPQEQIVAHGSSFAPADQNKADYKESQNDEVKKRFDKILKHKGIPSKEQTLWREACLPTLTARIRDDAVWVDRSACFERATKRYGKDYAEQWNVDSFFFLLGGVTEYFQMPDDEAAAAADSKDFVQKAGNWLSANWGAGAKSDSGSIATLLETLAAVKNSQVVGKSSQAAFCALLNTVDADPSGKSDSPGLFKQLKQAVGWKGRPSKGAMALEKLLDADTVAEDLWKGVQAKLEEEAKDQRGKGSRSAGPPEWMSRLRKDLEERIAMPYRIQKDLIWEHAVMLDHALRRVSAGHTWIKRAEVSRSVFLHQAASLGRLKEGAPLAIDWLDNYCESRSAESDSRYGYSIRKNAIDGWEDVLKQWNSRSVRTTEDRVEAVRALQDDLEKFGDARLFEDLATDEAKPVWESGPQFLKDYVSAKEAEQNQRRFKVPAYRHPDPLRNPIYTDYGNSRWGISYSALKAVQGAEKRKERLQNIEKKLAQAKTDKARQKLLEQKGELEQPLPLNEVSLDIWNGDVTESLSMKWAGTRLKNDLNFDQFEKGEKTVSRADRFGRGQAGGPGVSITVAEVFQQKDWNGRLQAPRPQLDRLADLVYGKKRNTPTVPDRGEPDYERLHQFSATAKKTRDHLKWFLSFSARLVPHGPMLEFAHLLPKEWTYNHKRMFLNYAGNKTEGRKGRTRIHLARLPAGLRILSFDLGHRYGAACAVWETLTTQQLRQEIATGKALRGGTSDKDLFLHLERVVNGKTRTVIYRRIAPETLPDRTASSATWTRLERQFLIKLQGETRRPFRKDLLKEDGKYRTLPPTRLAFNGEMDGIDRIRGRLGLSALNRDGLKGDKRLIDSLIEATLKEVKQALRRYGDVARVASALQGEEKPKSGGRKIDLTLPENAELRRESTLDALALWKDLAQSPDPKSNPNTDSWISDRYSKWIVEKFGGPDVHAEPPQVSGRSQRHREQEGKRTLFQKVVPKITERDRQKLYQEWSKYWEQQKSQWESALRELRRLILPRPGRKPQHDSELQKEWKRQVKELRHVGGLSYRRLRNIRNFYRLSKAYRMRPEPQDLTVNVPVQGDETLSKYGRRILNQMERLREQRVKQLASRIVEAALGLGSENFPAHGSGRRHLKRPQQPLEDKDPRFAPCHIVVGEDLKNYRPEPSRTRRENRQLADWSARNVRKSILEGCQLNGLHFTEVSPSWTSRQDSRTGAPGYRCQDIAIRELQNPPPYLQKRIQQAQELVSNGKKSPFLYDVIQHLDRLKTTVVRFPNKSGELFVSTATMSQSSSKNKLPPALQADLNAAANIGLKALIDPDWPAAWWSIPVSTVDGTTSPKDFPGSPLLGANPLPLLKRERDADKVKQTKTNAWRDPSVCPLDAESPPWIESNKAYWQIVESRIIRLLSQHLFQGADLEFPEDLS